MSKFELNYLGLLDDLLKNGKESSDRTGVGTYKVFGRQLSIDLTRGFPMLTTKKMYRKAMVHELIWMINGDTNIQYLLKNGVTFWTEWPLKHYNNTARELKLTSMSELSQMEFEQKIINDDEFARVWGSIGEYGYGRMWRDFPVRAHEDKGGTRTTVGGTDQLFSAIHDLQNNPDSRRIIITSWHPYHSNRLEDALLPACHNYIQFTSEKLSNEERESIASEEQKNKAAAVAIDHYDKEGTYFNELTYLGVPTRRLNCYFNMRSNDVFLGLPYNIAFYALFTHMVAQVVNMQVGTLVYSGVDVHLYKNHVEQAKTQLQRVAFDLPTIKLNPKVKNIEDFKYEDVELLNYVSGDPIKADVAV